MDFAGREEVLGLGKVVVLVPDATAVVDCPTPIAVSEDMMDDGTDQMDQPAGSQRNRRMAISAATASQAVSTARFAQGNAVPAGSRAVARPCTK